MLDLDRKEKLEKLLLQLKISKDVDLCQVHQALIHPSYVYEGKGDMGGHNQRLEFLGDAIVGLVIGQHLYEKYPQKSEGELTKMRATIVCEASLFQAAKKIGLGEYLLLGKGEKRMGGSKRISNLADCFEAFIGSIYLSVGLEEIRKIIFNVLSDKIEDAAKGDFGDYKTGLQEYVQKEPNTNLCYKIIKEEGPDHAKMFWAAVYLNEKELAQGKGKTKKEAEQEAAKCALNQMGD
ncbi:MAG: ribonuclease III [Clostridia bacterium]|nr:ribonuclease III [Clostridia bacterium]